MTATIISQELDSVLAAPSLPLNIPLFFKRTGVRSVHGSILELRVEVLMGSRAPVINVWCLGAADKQRVCSTPHDVQAYFEGCGVSDQPLREMMSSTHDAYDAMRVFYRRS